jgi:glycosyltransferase involved in cell wall biosynthesis
MRIGIDARFLTHPQVGGFKTYTESLLRALAQVDTENEYLLYVDRAVEACRELSAHPNFTVSVVTGTRHLLGMASREQVSLPRRAARDRIDLLHSPALTAPLFLPCPLVVTIHDMIWLGAGGGGSVRRSLLAAYWRAVARSAARRAKAIITVSQTSMKDVVELLGLDPRQVVVTYEAADPRFRPLFAAQVETIRRKLGLPRTYVMALGSADSRKNLDGLVNAYALLPAALRADHPLVIVWAHAHLAAAIRQQVSDLGLVRDVHLLGSISNEELVSIYNGASVFVFPSLAEGFGLPVLEAMACGTPVVASNCSSIPEIAGDAAILFDATDSREMAEAMTKILTDTQLRGSMTTKGLQRASAFTWRRCAEETVAVYRAAAARNRLSC